MSRSRRPCGSGLAYQPSGHQTKPDLAWALIERAWANGLPFVAVDMDDLYSRNRSLRRRLEAAEIEYYGDIPANTIDYLDQPRFETKLTKRGKPAKHKRVVAQHRCQAQDLLTKPDLTWTH